MNSGYYAIYARLILRTATQNARPPNLKHASAIEFCLKHNVLRAMPTTSGNSSHSTLNQRANEYRVLSANSLDASQDILERNGNDVRVAIESPGCLPIPALDSFDSLTLAGARTTTTSQMPQRAIESSNVGPVTSGVKLVSAQREVVTMSRAPTIFSNLSSTRQQCKNCRALAKLPVRDSRSQC